MGEKLITFVFVVKNCKSINDISIIHQRFVDSFIKQSFVISHKNVGKRWAKGSPQLGLKKCPVYLHLPWLGNVSMRYETQIKTAIKRCCFAVERTMHCLHHQTTSACSQKGCTTRFSSKQHCLPISVPLR